MVHTYVCVYVCLSVGVFRECGGARCVQSMVQYRVCRSMTLAVIQQLIVSNGGDEDFAALLGLMHTSPPDAIQFKMDIIKVIIFGLIEPKLVLSFMTRLLIRLPTLLYLDNIQLLFRNALIGRGFIC